MTSRFVKAVRRALGIQPPRAKDLVREGEFVRLTHRFYGPLRVMANDRYIGGYLQDGRTVFEADIVKVFRREIRGGRTVLDVGANLGLHSIVLAKHLRARRRGGRVVALEPHPEILPLTRYNCSPHAEIELIERAASDAATVFGMPRILHAANTGGVGLYAEAELRVESLAIDSLNLTDVEFMKIDVEGHELFAVRGAAETIRRCRPTMVIEVMGGHDRRTAAPDLVAEIDRRVQAHHSKYHRHQFPCH